MSSDKARPHQVLSLDLPSFHPSSSHLKQSPNGLTAGSDSPRLNSVRLYPSHLGGNADIYGYAMKHGAVQLHSAEIMPQQSTRAQA